MLYIHPEECIDCGACESLCPVTAIFAEADTPDQWKNFIEMNADYYKMSKEEFHGQVRAVSINSRVDSKGQRDPG